MDKNTIEFEKYLTEWHDECGYMTEKERDTLLCFYGNPKDWILDIKENSKKIGEMLEYDLVHIHIDKGKQIELTLFEDTGEYRYDLRDYFSHLCKDKYSKMIIDYHNNYRHTPITTNIVKYFIEKYGDMSQALITGWLKEGKTMIVNFDGHIDFFANYNEHTYMKGFKKCLDRVVSLETNIG